MLPRDEQGRAFDAEVQAFEEWLEPPQTIGVLDPRREEAIAAAVAAAT